MPRFDSVLFDLDGTLTNPRVAITASMAHALGEVGADVPPIEELVWCIGPPLRQNLGRLLGRDRAHLVEIAAQAYLRRYAIEGVRETTEYPVSTRCCIASAAPVRAFTWQRRNLSITPRKC